MNDIKLGDKVICVIKHMAIDLIVPIDYILTINTKELLWMVTISQPHNTYWKKYEEPVIQKKEQFRNGRVGYRPWNPDKYHITKGCNPLLPILVFIQH